MKKYILIFLLFTTQVFATNAIQPFEPTYFIAGDKEDQVKYQVSLKYGLVYPYDIGLFFAYTQLARWDLYDKSSPFREINYNPSVFWEKKNIIKFMNFVRISPYEHKSNGMAGSASRGYDRGYVQAQASYGKIFNVGIKEKVSWFYATSKRNHDIKRYIGFFETELFAQLKSKHGYIGHERIYFKGEWTHTKYWFETGLSFRIFTAKLSPCIYVQYYQGYSEFLFDYDKKTQALRIGLMFNPE